MDASIEEVETLTPEEEEAVKQAMKEYKEGKCIGLEDLEKELKKDVFDNSLKQSKKISGKN